MFGGYMVDPEMGSAQNVSVYPHDEYWSDHQREEGAAGMFVEGNPSTRHGYFQGVNSLFLDPQERREALARKNYHGVFHEEENNGKIRPCLILNSDLKPRLKWTTELHACFVDAVRRLGGPNKATPKGIMDTMRVQGLSLHHVKSHLQKYRLGKCNYKDWREQTNNYHRFQISRNWSSGDFLASGSASFRPSSNGYWATGKESSNSSQVTEKGSSPSSQSTKRKIGETSEPGKYKHIQPRIYLQAEAEKQFLICQEAQRRYLDLALESARNQLEAQYLGDTFQDLAGFPGCSAIPYPMYNPPPPMDASYPPYNTLEKVQAHLDDASQTDYLAATPLNRASDNPLVQQAEPVEPPMVEEPAPIVKEDPVDLYMNWEGVESMEFDTDFGLSFLGPFGITGLD